MKIAVLGGGFTGLTAAYYLANKGHEVVVFEKESQLGGMAGGFKGRGWDWCLERTYHHLFTNDQDILGLARETGFDDFIYKSPETASLYSLRHPELVSGSHKMLNQVQHDEGINNYRIIPLDTPQDLLNFPLLNFPDKIRAGMVLAFLKYTPFLGIYEKYSASEFLKKSMGEKAWKVLWQELFRKKFGKYAEKILTSFFWARIKKRTKQLVYVEGGFQTLINHLAKVDEERGVKINRGYTINQIEKRGEKFVIARECNDRSNPDKVRPSSNGIAAVASLLRNDSGYFDIVISTLPTPITARIGEGVLTDSYLTRLKKIKYLSAINLILETDKPVLDRTYWLNVCTSDNPIMILAQHTNFMDKKYYNNKHILYIGNYFEDDDKIMKTSRKEVFDFYFKSLKGIFPNSSPYATNYHLFKTPFGQPIFDKEFIQNKPDFTTPVKNFFIANLDMTYPYDRGTNYAVFLGKKVSQLIQS